MTGVLALAIESASAKTRVGGPKDEAADYELPMWAGVVPMRTVYGEPVPDEALRDTYPLPASVARLREDEVI